MNKLVITQDNSRTEYPVPNAVITALYNIGKDDDKNQSLTEGVDTTNNNRPVSTVSGSIRVATAYAHHLQYIAVKYPNLSITADSTYIYFADHEVEKVLLAAGIGDGVGISISAAANATIGTALCGNTTITSFDEFGYFSRANSSPSNEMFKSCSNLESIDLSNVTVISKNQFMGIAITDVNVPNLVQFTGAGQFAYCHQLKTVTNLGHVSNISDSCFCDCENLQSVVLPDECSSLDYRAFFISLNYWQYGGSLQTVSGINHVSRFGECCFQRQYQLRLSASDLQSAVIIEKGAFQYVPVLSINCPNLTSLAQDAFREDKALTSIECLGKISSIPSSCFNTDTALQTVKLPYECINIADNAFNGCSGLTSITQYNKSLDDYAEGESPTFTNISRITSFGDNCFYNCKLLSLTASDLSGATSIGKNAFLGTLLSGTLNLPNLTGILGESAFRNTQISSVSSLGSVTEIKNTVFGETNISSITIPNSVKKCSCNFVNNTPVPEIIFPEGVEEIYDGQFYTKNNSLTYIEIPSTVTNMGIFFYRSLENSQDNLCTVVIKATTPPKLNYYSSWEADDTRGDKFSGIYVPDASLTAYQNGAGAWQHSSIQAKLKPMSQLQTDNPTAWAKYNRTSTV